jgi:hypothetical protein
MLGYSVGLEGALLLACRIGVKPLVCGRMWREEANNGLT